MKAYTYNVVTFIFENEVDCYLDTLTNEYIIPNNATLISLPFYDINFELARFDLVNQVWNIEKIKLQGDYYLKSNGQYFTEIIKEDLNLYTTIAIKLNTGDIVHFDDINQVWIYDSKGQETLAKELLDAKETKKTTIYNQLLTITCTLDNGIYQTKLPIDEKTKNIFVNGKNYTPFSYYMFDNNNQTMILTMAQCDTIISKLGYLLQYIETSKIYNNIQIDNLTNIVDVQNYIITDKNNNAIIYNQIINLNVI